MTKKENKITVSLPSTIGDVCFPVVVEKASNDHGEILHLMPPYIVTGFTINFDDNDRKVSFSGSPFKVDFLGQDVLFFSSKDEAEVYLQSSGKAYRIHESYKAALDPIDCYHNSGAKNENRLIFGQYNDIRFSDLPCDKGFPESYLPTLIMKNCIAKKAIAEFELPEYCGPMILMTTALTAIILFPNRDREPEGIEIKVIREENHGFQIR